jgi:dipeptide transport system substrate-binding protein
VQLTDKDARTKLYMQAQKIHHDNVGWLNVAHSTVFEPTRKSVSGYKISPFGAHEFHLVDVAE